MYVNKSFPQPSLNQIHHLIAWASNQACQLGYKTTIYTLNSIIQTGAFYLILQNIDLDYFEQFNYEQQGLEIQGLFKMIQVYLMKQCGKRINIGLKNKILIQGSVEELVKLLLFSTLHSKKKDQYIQRVFNLDENIQSTLMKAIQEVSLKTMNIVNQNQILLRVQMLQNEIQTLKSQLGISHLRQQSSIQIIQQLQQEIKKKNKEIKLYKTQKQKAIQTLQLTSLQDYLTSFQRLQQQNKILNRYVQQLQETSNQYQENQRELKKEISNQANVICDLNDNVTMLKQKLCTLKLQNSYRNSFETCDVSRRSFGTQLLMNQKQNTNTALKDQRRSLNFDPFTQINDEKKKNPKQQQLIEEMKQLRKYNSDLIQKLQNAHKTLSSLNIQANMVKQKNQVLQKQNKFYKKQIGTLRKLQQKMQKDLISGII